MTPTAALTILAQAPRWDGHMSWGGGWMVVMGLFWMLLLVALVVGTVWAVTRSGGGPSRPDPTSRAREILNERYARGEISTEEYRERLDALR